MTDRRRILIVEDEEPTRLRLIRVIEAHGELEVVAAVGTRREALLALRRDVPEVLLVDLALPDGSGIDVHWNDTQCLEQAVAVARRQHVDLPRIEAWARSERVSAAKLRSFLDRL